MYAVVSTGGKQLKVEKGSEAVVEKLDAAVGETVTFDVLFVADDGSIIMGSDAESATVTAEVVEHFKGDKQMIFKFKKRKGYKRTKGHRQQQTRVVITDIAATGGSKKAAKKAEKPVDKKADKPVDKKAAEKPAPKAKAEVTEKVVETVETAADQCAAVKADGERCANKAKEGSKYCGVHAKKYDA